MHREKYFCHIADLSPCGLNEIMIVSVKLVVSPGILRASAAVTPVTINTAWHHGQ
jgi:hypothetical protein